MSRYLAILLIPMLQACAPGQSMSQAMDPTPEQTAARENYASASDEDRRFCDYEARKAAVSSNNRNYIVAAMQVNEQRASIFNACLRYRQGN